MSEAKCRVCSNNLLDGDAIYFEVCEDCRDNHSELEDLLEAVTSNAGAA